MGEFAKWRLKRRWWASGDGGYPPSLPRYPLWNRKLGELVYEDLVYSFMSIIGATMVLVVGLENMWNIVVSLFEEILLLSEDTRACHKY